MSEEVNCDRSLSVITKLFNLREVARGRLTKRLYRQLAPGMYLVSNCFDPIIRRPLFAEHIAAEHEGQWMRIRQSKAAQRLCHVFAGAQAQEAERCVEALTALAEGRSVERANRFADDLKSFCQSGLTQDQALAALKLKGASCIDCIKAVRAKNGCDLSEAMTIVHATEAWQDAAEAQQKLRVEILRILITRRQEEVHEDGRGSLTIFPVPSQAPIP